MAEIKNPLEEEEVQSAISSPDALTDKEIEASQREISESAREVSRPHADTPKAQFAPGEGVFATELIESREIIAIFEGELIESDSFPEDSEDGRHIFQVGPDKYIYAEEGIATNLKHSADPNCGVKEDNIVISIREIEPGEELTLDYRSFRTKDRVGEGRTFDTLKLEERRQYIRDGVVPQWILDEWQKEGKFSVETRNNEDHTPEFVAALSRTVMTTYTNNGEYAYCPCCDPTLPHGMRISARKAYGVKEKGVYVSLEEMDLNPILPDCGECGTEMKHFHTLQGTINNIQDKLDKDYQFWSVTMVDEVGEIVGFVYGYKAPLENGFKENWGDYYVYTDEETPAASRSFENFNDLVSKVIAEKLPEIKLNEEGKMNPSDMVFFINMIAVNPKYAGMNNVTMLGAEMYNMVPPEERCDPIIFEAGFKKPAYMGFVYGVGSKPVHGVLTPLDAELQYGDGILCVHTGEGIGKSYAQRNTGKAYAAKKKEV